MLVETLGDRCVSPAPVDAAEARPPLDGVRGAAPADIDALAWVLAVFSVLAHSLGEVIAEIDVNPVIVGHEGCLAVDALVIGGSASLGAA